jgi:hypothetical protein
MLVLNYGDWTFWEAYAPPNYLGSQKVTFDGPNRLILVNYGETDIDFKEDVYSAWKEWIKDPNHRENAGYAPALSVVGGDPLPGSRQLGSTYFIENGWRMRTWENDHVLTVTGNVFTREGASIFVPTLQPWTITINLNTSTLVEALTGQTSLSPTDRQAIASSVWSDATATSLINDIADIPANVWDEIIDSVKNETAREKLKKIATKTQDIALA